MKPLFNKICIVGVGLIGGSLGLAIKKRGLAKFVVGVTRRKETAKHAAQYKVVDMATMNLSEGVSGADLVILCGPVSVILDQIKILPKFLNKKTIVMDVGSSKVQIEKTAKKYFRVGAHGRAPLPVFVGCHPMAGSANRGLEYADADLFQGAQCFLASKNNKVEPLWKALGANPVQLSAKQHDEWVSVFSYLPHALAFSLFQNQVMKNFSASQLRALNPSVRELARLAKSDAALWSDIFISNESLLAALLSLEKGIHVMKQSLRAKNKGSLEKFIRLSNKNSQKFIPS